MRKTFFLTLAILLGLVRESSAQQLTGTVYQDNRTSIVQEFYFDQAFSSGGWNGKYVQPSTTLRFQFGPQLSSETVYFVYLPVSKDAAVQQFLDRSKLEYMISKCLRLGLGYRGYKYGDESWRHNPFFVANLFKGSNGLELWFEEPKEGTKLQFIYKNRF